MTRTSGKRRLAGVLLVLLAVALVAAPSIDWATVPQAPANKLQDPGLWTVADYERWTPAQKNNFAVGFWAGLYLVKVMLNHPEMDWAHFCTWLDYETGMDTEQMKAQVSAYGARHGQASPLFDALTADGLARADR